MKVELFLSADGLQSIGKKFGGENECSSDKINLTIVSRKIRTSHNFIQDSECLLIMDTFLLLHRSFSYSHSMMRVRKERRKTRH